MFQRRQLANAALPPTHPAPDEQPAVAVRGEKDRPLVCSLQLAQPLRAYDPNHSQAGLQASLSTWSANHHPLGQDAREVLRRGLGDHPVLHNSRVRACARVAACASASVSLGR